MKLFILKTTLLLFMLLLLNPVQGQNELNISELDSLIRIKEQDFNTVFIPLYNSKDTTAYNELLTKSRQSNYLLGEIIALNLIGTHYRDQSDYAKSVQHHLDALKLSEEHRILDGMLYSFNMLGVVYRRMDNVQKGLEYHFKALELAEDENPPTSFSTRNTAIAVNGIGNAYLILQEYESARKQFRRSLQIEESINNPLGLAINYQNIGITFEETGEPDSAMFYYQNSLKHNRDINNLVGQMICYNSIAGILMEEEKHLEALRYLNMAEEIALKNGDNFYTTTIYLKKANTLTALNRNNEALQYLDKSLKISAKHNLKTNLADTYAALGEYYEQRGKFQKALEYSKLSKEVEMNYLNENNLRIKNNLEISYDVESKVSEILALEEEKKSMGEAVAQKQKTIFILILLMIALFLLGILYISQSRLRKEKQMLELEQKALRAQMNPHFTFNALNSIKSYIISEDTEKAVKYLNRFSKLIRSVLHSSNKQTISLKEELEALESYVDIEQLRIGDPVKMQINVDGIDTNQIRIPPLILQPFVENALWHGLEKKQGAKHIIIDISRNGHKKIQIDITDNGIGRKYAARYRTPGHDSMGVSISRKRLDAFFKLNHQHETVTYSDLADNEGNPKGTRVSLSLPNSV